MSLVGAHGNRYPTAGTNIWVLHSAVQRNARYWAGAHGFRPERWLSSATSDSGDDVLLQSPPKGGWRAFEHGPRNCLG